MGYEIIDVHINGSKLVVSVKFNSRPEGTITLEAFSSTVDEATVLAKLDEIELNYPTDTQKKADLPAELQNLVGYKKV